MRRLTRRELFRGAGVTAIGGAALAVGLKPVPRERVILAGSRIGKSWQPPWTPPVHHWALWQKKVLEEIRKATFISNLSGDLGA